MRQILLLGLILTITYNISFSQTAVDSLMKLGNTFYKKSDFVNAAQIWEKAAKLQHEIVEENYSVSSDSGGKAKLKTDIRLKRMMKQAEGKKKEKYA